MKKLFALPVLALCALVVAGGNAFAALDLSSFTVSVADVETVALAIITALASLWGIRKIVKFVNRS